MIEVIHNVLGALFFLVCLFVLIESSRAISEKKKRQRMGLTDYYDQPIDKKKEEQ